MNNEGGALYTGLTTDNKQFIEAMNEAERRVKGFSGATAAEGAKINKTLNDITKESIKMSGSLQKEAQRELGLIADLENALTELREKRRNAQSIEEITKYNQKIKEGEQDLKDYTQAGLKQEEVTENLTQSVGKWALSLGGATAILGLLKKAFQETTGGMNLFNIVGAGTKQILYDISSGAGLSTAKLGQAVSLQRELNDLRLKEYGDSIKAAQYNNQYQQLYSDSLDATLSRTEKIELIDKALAAHNKAIDVKQENVREQMRAVSKGLDLQPANEKLLKEYSELIVQMQNLDAERVSSTKRLTRQRSILIKEGIDEELEWRKKLHEDLQKLADEQIEIDKENADKFWKSYLDWYKDQIEEQIKKLEKLKADNMKVVESFGKVDPGKGFSILDRAITNTGDEVWKLPTAKDNRKLRPSKAKQYTEAEIQKREDKLDKELQTRRQITEAAASLVYQLGQAAGMSEEGLNYLGSTLDVFQSMVTGNWIGAIQGLISSLVTLIPKETATLEDKIQEINAALREQERLIEKSQRAGNSEVGYYGKLEELKKQKQLLEDSKKAVQAATGTRLSSLFGVGLSPDEAAKKIKEINEQIKETENTIEDTKQELKDLYLGEGIENNIADALIQGFESGKFAAQDYSEFVNETLKQAILNAFIDQQLLPMINSMIMPVINEAMTDNKIDAIEKEKIQNAFGIVSESLKPVYDSLTSIFPNASAADRQLSGAIKGITEQQADILAGQTNAIRITQLDTNQLIRQQLMHLSEIAANTRYLQSIDNKLSSMSSDTLRAQGLN